MPKLIFSEKPYRLLCFFIHHSQIKTKLLKDIAKNKNKGSKRDPCGTTALGTSHPEVCSLRVTFAIPPLCDQLIRFLLTSCCLNLSNNILPGAFDMSKNNP